MTNDKTLVKDAAKRLEEKFPGVRIGTGLIRTGTEMTCKLFVWTANSPDDLPKDFPTEWEGYSIEWRQTPKAL